MIKTASVFLRSCVCLVGAVIGVGIFGLPYVFAQAGYGIGLGYLLIVGAMSLILVYSYADLLLYTNGHHRLAGNVRQHLGAFWGRIASIVLFCTNWGAMLAYILLGGEFLHALLGPLIGGGASLYQLTFFIIFASLLIGGLGFISRMEAGFVFVLLVLLLVIMGGSVPHMEMANLLVVDLSSILLPFGVVFFAFGGIATVPEMKAVLGRHKSLLKKGILWSFGIITLIYILFTASVVSVSGIATTEDAIIGLGNFVGDWAVVIGSLVGLFAVSTSFLILGVQVMDTAIYDYKARYLAGWAWAISVPFLLFLFGARDFIHVIGFTGGVFGVMIGWFVIVMYKRAKMGGTIPKRTLVVPNWTLDAVATLLFFGMFATIWETFS